MDEQQDARRRAVLCLTLACLSDEQLEVLADEKRRASPHGDPELLEALERAAELGGRFDRCPSAAEARAVFLELHPGEGLLGAEEDSFRVLGRERNPAG